MTWWETLIEGAKTYAAADQARDARKSAERIAAQNLSIAEQEAASMRAYAALSVPRPIVQATPSAPYVSPVSSPSAFDAYLPMIVIGIVAFGAFAILRH